MFILYTADLEDAVAAHDVRLHAYADDTQLYLKCQAQEATTAAHTLEACITDVTACSGVGRILVWGGASWQNGSTSALEKTRSDSHVVPGSVPRMDSSR